MDGETTSTVENVIKIRTLVVDNDVVCLGLTASVLGLYNYQAVTATCPLQAMATLRTSQGAFDIVLSDIEMTLMSGLDFQYIVQHEFHIPVILMSTIDKRHILMKSLKNGAGFYIIKPPNIEDIKNIWNYVTSRKRGVVVIEQQPSNNETREETNGENNGSSSNNKKHKIQWSTMLHQKFVEAVTVIGMNRAVPKKILEYMNVPGLRRENIASHLQKYRLQEKRKREGRGSMQHDGSPQSWEDMPYRHSFSWSQDNNNMSLGNSQSNACFPSYVSNIGTNLVHGDTSRRYDSPFQSINTLDSSMLNNNGLQNNLNYLNHGNSTNAAMQFMPPAPAIPTTNWNGINGNKYNNGGAMLMNSHGIQGGATQFPLPMLNSNFNPFEMNGSALTSINNGLMVQPQLLMNQNGLSFDGNFNNMFNFNNIPMSNYMNMPNPMLSGQQFDMMPNLVDMNPMSTITPSIDFSNVNQPNVMNNNFTIPNEVPSMDMTTFNNNFSTVMGPLFPLIDSNNISLVNGLSDTNNVASVGCCPQIASNICAMDQPVPMSAHMNHISTENAIVQNNANATFGMQAASDQFNGLAYGTLDQALLMPDINNHISTENVIATPGINGSTTSQVQENLEKDTSTLGVTCASPPPLDWAPNFLDDFAKDYNIGDLSSIFSSIDAKNGNKP